MVVSSFGSWRVLFVVLIDPAPYMSECLLSLLVLGRYATQLSDCRLRIPHTPYQLGWFEGGCRDYRLRQCRIGFVDLFGLVFKIGLGCC
jgi:hypothetical protein